MDEFYQMIKNLPQWLAEPLARFPEKTACRIQELRLRTNRPIFFTRDGTQHPAAALPGCPLEVATLRLTQEQMDEIFYTLCGGSVHTHQSEILQGYITTFSGCRVGVAGSYVTLESGEIALQQIGSVNIRVARAVSISLPLELTRILQTRFIGMLIAGEPGSGKTTLLRQIARFLAATSKSVSVVDERSELFPTEWRSEDPLDLLSGLEKPKALQIALRTLSPQVVLLDELGGMEEIYALEQGFFGGVDLVATIHSSCYEEAMRRPQIRYMKQQGMLRVFVFLRGRQAPGQIKEVMVL